MASASGKYIESLIVKLSSKSESGTKKALIELTKLTKGKENVHWFRVKGGLKHLLSLIQRPNRTIADMALSALANCAREQESKREIRRLDGIATLADVLKMSEKISILNRTSRALANLAEDELNVFVMEELGVIPELVKLLMKTSDSDCQESVLRALRMLCTTSAQKQVVLDLDAMEPILEMLKSDKPALVNCCIRTVAELTKGCSREIAQQIQDYGGVKYIVELANSESMKVRHPALLSLANLAHHAHVRVCIGIEGGIQALTQQLKREETGHVMSKVIEGLCFCCREGINRARVKESSALELLLKVLVSGKCLSLNKKIVYAFSLFCWYEAALDVLLTGGLVPALINHLNRIISDVPFRIKCDDHDEEFSDHLPFTSDVSLETAFGATASKQAFLDASASTLMDESFLQRVEEIAKEVSDSKVSGQLSNFKRRSGLKLKPSPIPTTPPPGVCTIGHGQSMFSLASRQTDTTSLVSVCTYSRSISSLACSSSHSPNLLSSSCPSVLSTYHASTAPAVNTSIHDSDEPSGLPCTDTKSVCTESQQATLDLNNLFSLRATASQSDQSVVIPANSQTEKITNESLSSPLTPKARAALYHHRGLGHSTLLLLCRISQMTDQSALLVTKPCIQALLDYLRLVENPSPKCARLLNNLAKNSLRFKALIVNGAVVAVHHQLCCMRSESQEIVEATKNEGTPSTTTCRSGGQSLQTPCYTMHSADSNTEQENKIKASGTCHVMSSSTQSYCQETGKHLLETFSTLGQTPFGKGVLENLLLKGSKGECEECVLALPLLCRTKKLKQQMLVERKGLEMFCDLFKSVAPNGETFTVAVESLVVLANDLQLTFPAEVVEKEPDAISKGLTEPADDKIHDPQAMNTDTSADVHQVKRLKVNANKSLMLPSKDAQHCIKKEQVVDCSSCSYNENANGPHDVAFRMDSGDVIVAHKEVMKSVSDVFTAMLSSRFIESTQSVIPIPDVSAGVFEFALHHMYGCNILPSNEQSCVKMLSSVPCCCEVLRGKVSNQQGIDPKVRFFLDVLTFSDRFMLDKLRTVCETFLVTLISTSTVVQICTIGLQLNSPQLCVNCLSYLMDVKLSNLPTRLHVFRELFICVKSEDIVKHLYQLLLSHLKL